MRLNVEASREEIAAFCERWQVTQLAVFGSALREDFGPESDIDLLVSFDENARHTLFDMVRMEEELKKIFGRDVDLVERAGIEQSRNHIRREAILESAEAIYPPSPAQSLTRV